MHFFQLTRKISLQQKNKKMSDGFKSFVYSMYVHP